MIDMRRDAVNFVVRSHHAADMGLLHDGLKGNQEVFADNAFRIVARRGVGSAFRLSMNREMLHGGDYVIAAYNERVALQGR